MGENIGAIGDEGREGTDRRILPVYSIGCGAGRAYTIGDSVGRYAIAGTVHKASEECICRASEGSD